MGFLNKLFGGRKEYPELDAASPAARRLDDLKAPLTTLANEVNEDLEVVPSDRRTFVFIGKPPKRFGLAWIEGDQVKNLKTLADESGVAPDRMGRIVNQLREAYQHTEEEPRYQAVVAGRPVVVAPSERLKKEVEGIIQSAQS